jgi:ubiquinone/menaquinone biosynthesis C-methylase UbiE
VSEQENKWQQYQGDKIPASLTLFPIIFKFLKPNYRVLDIGCGFGKTCFDLFERGYGNLSGIDLSKNGIDFAREKLSGLGMKDSSSRFIVADAQKIPFGDSQFDFIITQAFWTSIMPQERKIIMHEIQRLLKKGGYYYLAQFGQTWEDQLYRKRYEDGRKKGYENGSFDSIDKETGRLNYVAHHYTKEELEKMLKLVGLNVVHYSKEVFTTQGGNKTNGHVIIANK